MTDVEESAGIDWDGVSDDMARTIMEQGEAYLKAQLDISLASDRRALTFASIFTTAATAVLAASIASFGQRGGGALLLAGLATGTMMVVASALGFYAARPIKWYAPGSPPAQWWHGRLEKLASMMGGQSENYQTMIEHNSRCLDENADKLRLAGRFAISAPIVGFAVWCGAIYLFAL